MADIRFEQVTKKFGETLAVDDLDLYIQDKEFMVLVGPSGCGKSTILRLLSGLEEVTDGEIYIGPRKVNNVPAKDRDIAMVFQSYALYPHMSVHDNMSFGLRLRKMPKKEIERRVQEAARILGIGDLLKRKPRQLSGGQRQRVALGRAIVREPAAFLLDEPLSNLDAKLRVQTRTELSKLHKRLEITFVYVTHDQIEAMTMADRITVLNLGKVQQTGTPQELYENPDNVFVAGFIGSPAMNFFEVNVTNDADSLCLDSSAFRVKVPPGRAPALRPYSGKKIIFGIRPEDIFVPQFMPPGIIPAIVRAKVDVIELMGNETFLYLVADGSPFMARVDARTRAVHDQSTELAFNMSNFHAFDPDSEKAIRP